MWLLRNNLKLIYLDDCMRIWLFQIDYFKLINLLRVTFYSNKTDELMSLKIIESRNKMIIEKVTRERFK